MVTHDLETDMFRMVRQHVLELTEVLLHMRLILEIKALKTYKETR